MSFKPIDTSSLDDEQNLSKREEDLEKMARTIEECMRKIEGFQEASKKEMEGLQTIVGDLNNLLVLFNPGFRLETAANKLLDKFKGECGSFLKDCDRKIEELDNKVSAVEGRVALPKSVFMGILAFIGLTVISFGLISHVATDSNYSEILWILLFSLIAFMLTTSGIVWYYNKRR